MTERRILAATAVLSIGVPVLASAWVSHRTNDLVDQLSAAAGVPAHIGQVDADLTGTLRITDLALGRIVSAESIEASVGMSSLLSGQLGADEIRVAAPRIDAEIDGNGDSDLSRLLRRLVRSGAAGSGRARVRRVVVSSGTLVARLADGGELEADDVELVPDAGGVRAITGRVRIRATRGRGSLELELGRAAAELSLPKMTFGRMLAVAGHGSVTVGARTAQLRDVAVGRLQPGGPLELRAAVDDAGFPRSLEASFVPGDSTLTIRGDHVPLGVLAELAPHSLVIDDAHASGSLVVRRRATGLELAADGSFDGVTIDHRSIAPAPITLAGELRATVAITPDAIAVDHGELVLGAAHWSLTGWARRGTPASAELDLHLAQAPCADLLTSLPAELRGPLDGMVVTGDLSGHARLSLDLAAPVGDGAELAVDLHNHCDVLAEPPASDVTALAGTIDELMPDGSHQRIGKDEPGWVALHHLPSHVSAAFVAAEDARFYDHRGFDLHQIARSLEIDLRDRKLARGGSTISQQLIKNAFLTQRRSLDRKIQEAILTWRLEARLDKHAILERYLNTIELGPHVFGIAAAARYWFDEDPHDLTVRQAAFLAALTSEPTSMAHRVRHAGKLDPDTVARVDIVLRGMKKSGAIDADQLDKAKAAAMHFASGALRGE